MDKHESNRKRHNKTTKNNNKITFTLDCGLRISEGSGRSETQETLFGFPSLYSKRLIVGVFVEFLGLFVN